MSGISSIMIQLFLCEYSTYPSVLLTVTTILLYMICIRYYFEPIHNYVGTVYFGSSVVYDMYKILFCQHVKDHPLRCKYTMFFCNHQIFSVFFALRENTSRNLVGNRFGSALSYWHNVSILLTLGIAQALGSALAYCIIALLLFLGHREKRWERE